MRKARVKPLRRQAPIKAGRREGRMRVRAPKRGKGRRMRKARVKPLRRRVPIKAGRREGRMRVRAPKRGKGRRMRKVRGNRSVQDAIALDCW